MRNTIVIALICLFAAGCKKASFTTKPQLTFKSINTNELRPGQVLEIKLTFTDAEGDVVSDSALYIEQVSTFCPQTSFSRIDPITEFPVSGNLEGTILVKFGYRTLPQLQEPQCGVTDTCYFRFALRDKEKNVSDTITSASFVLIKE